MARINIEDDLFKKNKFFVLSGVLGGRRAAIGALVEMWITAQRFWLLNQNGIPKPVWEEEGLANELITTGFAEDRGDFIYARGSEAQFSWLVQRSNAGKKGGSSARRNHKGISESTVIDRQSFDKPLSLSLSLSQKETHIQEATKTSNHLKESVEACVGVWGETLQTLGVKKDPKYDEMTIARLIQKYGANRAWHMLRGQRWETGGPDWDVRKHLSAMKILNDQAKAEKLENLSMSTAHSGKKKPKYADEESR